MSDTTQESKQAAFSIEKIYVKDLSLEIPHAPKIFLERANPQMDVGVQTQTSSLDEEMFEVVVSATVTAKLDEKVMFLIEAKQAGIFKMRNVSTAELETILAVMCPNILFPYLREVVSDMAVRGGFAPAFLNPVNFEALYQQQRMLQSQASQSTPAH